MVKDSNGCAADTFLILKVLPRLPMIFRNIITPNGDDINDVWKVLNLEMYVPVKLNIFNRYGEELYSTDDYKNDWGGTYKGEKLAEGTYYYIFITKDGKTYKGTINIMR
jgi:gliding motility-associated-like protein